MPVPILRQGSYLIASTQAALSDADLGQLQADLLDQVGRFHARAVLFDVSAMDVLDSFATRSIRTIAQLCKLRGARIVIVGIQPDVAFAMVQLGLIGRLEDVETALDLEEGIALLGRKAKGR
jgi:rsbT antagonist protein RsbS